MGIKIITDSTSYISKIILDKLDIEILSLSVSFGDETYKEIEISNKDFFEKLNKNIKFPKSSQPALNDVIKLFDNILKNGDDLIGIFLSSEMSGTYSSAVMVKNEMMSKYPERKIEIIDSRSNCMQLGFSVIVAAEAAKKGDDFENIIENVNQVILKSRFIFIPDTLEYLHRGGRIGMAKSLIGSVLKIKPILSVKNGITYNVMKVRTRKKAINSLIDLFNSDIIKNEFMDAVIHHIDCEKDALELAKIINEKSNKKIEIVDIGPVIGVHVGPGAIGIAYYWR